MSYWLLAEDGSTVLDSASVMQRVVGGDDIPCEDNVDNDGDGLIDYPQDPGCTSPQGGTEGNGDPATEGDFHESTLTIRYQARAFTGIVSTDLGGCLRDRLVFLRKKTTDGVQPRGRTHTNRRGVWTVERPQAHGHFFAIVKFRYFTDGHGTIRRCSADRSVVIRV